MGMTIGPARENDGVRGVTAPTRTLALQLLQFCATNTINDNAGLDTKLRALTQTALNQVVITLIEGLCDVGPPHG